MSETKPTYDELQARVAELEAAEQKTKWHLNRLATIDDPLDKLLAGIWQQVRMAGLASTWGVYLLRGDELGLRVAPGQVRPDLDSAQNESFRAITGRPWLVDSESLVGAAYRADAAVAVADMQGEDSLRYPETRARMERIGRLIAPERRVRSTLALPLRFAGERNGVLVVSREEVRPFTDEDVAAIQPYADQMALAIGNARAAEQLEERNRELAEALAQQTAMAEVLSIIAGSPTDLQPVFDAIAERAAVLSGSEVGRLMLVEGENTRFVGSFARLGGPVEPLGLVKPLAGRTSEQVVRTGQPFHEVLTPDDARRRFAASVDSIQRWAGRPATIFHLPLLRSRTVVGVLTVGRFNADLYSEKHVALMQAFADQAVIAIENARLFNAQQEAVEQLTATAEVLEIVSKSPTDLQPVFDAIAAKAADLCESDDAGVSLLEDGRWRRVSRQVRGEELPSGDSTGREPDYGTAMGRAVLEGRTVHLWGPPESIEVEFPSAAAHMRAGQGSIVSVPLISSGRVLGTVSARRLARAPYTPRQISLLETFADQAVIAIENARLFNELQERNREVTESLTEQTRLREQQQGLLETVTKQAEELRSWSTQLEKRVDEEVREVERLRMFERFVAPSLAEALSEGGEDLLRSHRREVAVVFTDLRGWTPFSETGEPEDVMTVLNELHQSVGPLVFEHQGTILQFTGDGLLILLNDPLPCEDPAGRAVHLAMAMQERMRGLGASWRRRGHELDMGVAVAFGYATCGRIGFEGRYEYTAIGTVVNLASRLCAAAKPGQVLVSQRVQALVDDQVETELAGEMELKGFARAVPVYSVVGERR